MSEIWTMFQKGAGVGAWVLGAGLVIAIALPVFGIVLSMIAWVLRGGKPRKGDAK